VVATTIVLECLNASSALLEERRRSWNARTNVTTVLKVGINQTQVRRHVWIVFQGNIKRTPKKKHAWSVRLVEHLLPLQETRIAMPVLKAVINQKMEQPPV
jgi:hypothetical protein